MGVVLALFAARLVQLQGMESASYRAKAENQRLINRKIPAVRGKITDAAGRPLAMTVEKRLVYADPSLVSADRRPGVAAALAAELGVPAGDIARKLAAPTSPRYVELAHGVSPLAARRILARDDLAGVGAVPEYQRAYPNGQVAANLIGFVGRDGRGRGGLESAYEKTLAGRDGSQSYEQGAGGEQIPMGRDYRRPPVPGTGLRLTIDRDIQWKAQQACAAQVRRTSAESCTVVVMDPRTGHVLALATTPTFDPARVERFEDTANRPLTEAYEPGSTNKIITAAAALEQGVARLDTPFTVPYRINVDGFDFHDAEPHPTERMTLAGVLAHSSNTGIVQLSQRIEPEVLHRYMRAFGYGRPTGLELPGETPGILAPPDKWWGNQRYTIAFGQGIAVNAVQVASVFATIANGGVRVTPTLVAGTLGGDGSFAAAARPGERRVIKPETAAALRAVMEMASREGTGQLGQIPRYRIAAKTGTAERAGPTGYRGYTSTYVGFAPADDPRLVVEVVLQDPLRRYYGGEVSAPVFKEVMSFALKTAEVAPTGTAPPRLPLVPIRKNGGR